MTLADEVLLRGADELAPQARRLLSVMVREASERTSPSKSSSFTRRELRELTGWSEHQVRIGLARLVALEYVAERRDRPGLRHTYALVDDPAGVRETSREVREPDSRGALPSPPARRDPFARATRKSSSERPNVGAVDVGEDQEGSLQ